MEEDEEEDAQRQSDEIEALRAIFPADGEVELLSEHPLELLASARREPVRLRVRLIVLGSQCSVVLTLPPGYPSKARPAVLVEGLAGPQSEAAHACLAASAALHGDGECLLELLQSLGCLELENATVEEALEAVESAPPPEGERWRAILRIDHMNDPRGYTKALERMAREEGLTLKLFYRVEEARYRDVHCVIDAPDRMASGCFLKKFRTQNMDLDRCGKPCRERKSEVLHEFPLGAATVEERPAFASTEYASPSELAQHLATARRGCPAAAGGSARAAAGERPWASAIAGGTRLHVCVCPGRRASGLTNLEELRRDPSAPALRADLCAPPREGEANADLVRLISSELRVPTARVSLLGGGRSRDKVLKVAGVTPDEVEAILLGPGLLAIS